MVDPGHGGHDPGTRSEDGLLEKDLALQIARRLADALERRGVNAVLTRDRDMYLTLAQRTAIANRLSPELFVSVHLNWSPNPRTTGMEVYYLNNTTDRATIRLARMENAADNEVAPLDPNLNYILSDLRQQYKATQSALLAQVMEQQTVSALQAGFGNEIHGLGAKRGPFYVLVGPRIPAVLVECGFLSNAQEAQRLASAAYQQAIADGSGQQCRALSQPGRNRGDLVSTSIDDHDAIAIAALTSARPPDEAQFSTISAHAQAGRGHQALFGRGAPNA